MASRVTAVLIASGTADAKVYDAYRGLRYHGFSAAENAGTPAVASFHLENGIAAALGAIVETVSLGASVSRSNFIPQGIPCPDGIFLDRIAGTTIVVVYLSVDN